MLLFLPFKELLVWWVFPYQRVLNDPSHVQTELYVFVKMFLLLPVWLTFILSDAAAAAAQHPDFITYSPFLPHFWSRQSATVFQRYFPCVCACACVLVHVCVCVCVRERTKRWVFSFLRVASIRQYGQQPGIGPSLSHCSQSSHCCCCCWSAGTTGNQWEELNFSLFLPFLSYFLSLFDFLFMRKLVVLSPFSSPHRRDESNRWVSGC